MKLRDFQIADFPEICEWWRARKFPFVPLRTLSSIGIVVEDEGTMLAVCWCYVSNSSLTWIEWVTTNPKAPLRKIRPAIDLLIADAKYRLKGLGGETVYVQLKSKSLMKVYEAHGFKKGDTNMTHYGATL